MIPYYKSSDVSHRGFSMDILTILYTATGFIFGIAYVPQIITLLKDTSGAAAINLTTAFLFTVCSTISCAYAVVNNGDLYFVFGTAVCTIGNITVLVLALLRRWQKANESTQDITSHIAPDQLEVATQKIYR